MVNPKTIISEGQVWKTDNGQRVAVKNVDGLDVTVKWVSSDGTVMKGDIPTQTFLDEYTQLNN